MLIFCFSCLFSHMQIYEGQVTSTMKFGCFVRMNGVLGKKNEGLVHISQLSREGRVNEVTDVANRNQAVKVKVISFTGGKIGLSMKVILGSQHFERITVPLLLLIHVVMKC